MLESSVMVHQNYSIDVQEPSKEPAKCGDVIRKGSRKRRTGHLLSAE